MQHFIVWEFGFSQNPIPVPVSEWHDRREKIVADAFSPGFSSYKVTKLEAAPQHGGSSPVAPALV